MDGNRAATLAGFVGALAVLAVLVWVVGVDRTVSALLSADPAILPLVGAVAVVWLTAWGLALWSVLRALGSPVRTHVAVLAYAGAVFSNNVTPFGQAGGEPLSALLISSAADTEYETGLAAIASIDTAHFVPSVGFAVAGFTFVAASAVRLGRDLLFAAGAVAALAVGLPVAAFVGWRYRYELEDAVVRLLTPVIRWVGRVVPKWSPPTAERIAARIESFFAAIERIATDRRTLLQTLGFSALGLSTYEMAYMGLPVLLIPGTDFNTRVARRYASTYSFAAYVGEKTDLSPPDVAASFTKLAKDTETRERMAARGSQVVASEADQVVEWVAELVTENEPSTPIERPT